MQDRPQEDNGATLFEATLYPYRSLSREGFGMLMTAVVAVAFTAGFIVTQAGAWPTAIFLALDVVLIFAAFKLNYRSGRLVETVRLTREVLEVRRIHPDGKVEEWRLQPYWLRVETIPTETGLKAPPAEVRLYSHGKSLGLGRFLTDPERESFADALGAALARCRSLPE